MGYFRLFYYIAYVLNFVMRMLKRHGKFILLAVCIFIFLVVCMYNPKSNAAYEGNTTYTDPNQLLFSTYHSFCLDFLRRYDVAESYTGTTNKEDIDELIHNKLYNYYIFYGAGSEYYEAPATNGGSMLNQTTYQNRSMYIIFMDNSVNSFERTQTSNTYFGIHNVAVDKFKFTDLSKVIIYRIANNTITKLRYLTSTSYVEIFIPGPLWFYNDNYIFDYFYNNMSVTDLELLFEMNEKLGQVTNTVQETQDYLTEEPSANDFSSSDLPSDSGVTDTTETGLTNIFSQIYNAFTGTPSNQNNIIVPIPYTR